MSRPFYTEFAWAYDLLIQEPVDERLAFVTHMLAQYGVVSGARVLDAGCGTGRYSIALAQLGYKVTGIDTSPQQLAEAQKRKGKSGAKVDFIIADICTSPPIVIFDAILCRGVLNDLTDDASRRAVFLAFASMLRHDGVLVLDVREWVATEARKRSHPVFEKEVETDKGRLRFRSVTELVPETKTLMVFETHHIESHEGSREETFTFSMRCWTQEELEVRLTDAGFRSVQYFGDYDTKRALGFGDRIVAVSSLGKRKEQR